MWTDMASTYKFLDYLSSTCQASISVRYMSNMNMTLALKCPYLIDDTSLFFLSLLTTILYELI